MDQVRFALSSRWLAAETIGAEQVTHPDLVEVIELADRDQVTWIAKRSGRHTLIVVLNDYQQIDFVAIAHRDRAARIYHRTSPDEAIGMYARHAVVMVAA